MGAPSLSAADVDAIFRALEQFNDNQTHAANALGIPRKTFANRLNRAKALRSQSQSRPFVAPVLPSSKLPLADLIKKRIAESERVIEADDATHLIRIQLNTPGPVGLMVFGDPHVDNSGCNFKLLHDHLAIAAKRPEYVFAGNIGDITDNWVGRLQRLYAESGTTVSDAWRLAEWMLRGAGVNWLFLVRGNHDAWSGPSDPLDWIMRGSEGVDQPHGVRLALDHPNGVETRINARHNFKGNSQFNPLHGLAREQLFGHRDHIVVAGHLHMGADAGDVMPCGTVTQLVRTSGYKVVDDYAKQGQFRARKIHPSAMVIIDPSKPDNCRSRVWCAPTVEEGADYLDWLRSRFERGAKTKVKAQ
jgi:hypothetical protein